MAEAAKAIADYAGENILYINVMNNISVDCDCDSNPAAPVMEDIDAIISVLSCFFGYGFFALTKKKYVSFWFVWF